MRVMATGALLGPVAASRSIRQPTHCGGACWTPRSAMWLRMGGRTARLSRLRANWGCPQLLWGCCLGVRASWWSTSCGGATHAWSSCCTSAARPPVRTNTRVRTRASTRAATETKAAMATAMVAPPAMVPPPAKDLPPARRLPAAGCALASWRPCVHVWRWLRRTLTAGRRRSPSPRSRRTCQAQRRCWARWWTTCGMRWATHRQTRRGTQSARCSRACTCPPSCTC
mmetsp:Transcript_11759/g.34748  ORF Transcript_11759/g.34748 Transcript_11759/m.34748 type:complete len:227 (-) Transcript_11759:504-1184(-)